MRDLIRVAVVCGFVAMGLRVARASAVAGTPNRRRASNSFIVYTLVVSFGAGLLQRDLWPFSNWPLVAGIHAPDVVHPRAMVVDGSGREYQVDYRAWRPFAVDELVAWLDAGLLRLDGADRDVAAAYLLAALEAARLEATEEGRIRTPGLIWGPIAAPYFLLHPPWWDSSDTRPAGELLGFRLYYERWNIEERSRDPAAVERELVYEFRRP